MTMHRFVIGFGFERDKTGRPTGFEHDDLGLVAHIVEGIAARTGVLCYSLRFGPGSWDNGIERVNEQGGTVEYVGSVELGLVMRRFAEAIRDAFKQECVVFYHHPVSEFSYI